MYKKWKEQSEFRKTRKLAPNCTDAAAKSLQSCPTLCDHIDGSPPGSAIPRILQARTLEWVAISFSNAWKWKVKVKSLSRIRLPDCSPQGSSVHGIFQARVLECGAIAFSDVYVYLCINQYQHLPGLYTWNYKIKTINTRQGKKEWTVFRWSKGY